MSPCRYGFLYEEYVEEVYAYESLVLLRKLSIAIFLVFLSANSIQTGVQVRQDLNLAIQLVVT